MTKAIHGYGSIDGFLCFSGPNIKQSSVDMSLVDIAPTLLGHMNLPIPKTMNGRDKR